MLAELCAASYSGTPRLPGFESYAIEILETEVYLLWNDSQLIIVFRGSSSLVDWITDLSIHIGVDGVHHGFKVALDRVIYRINKEMDERGLKSHSIILTGHSLGGALATLAADSIHTNVQRVVTYGSPKVGDARFFMRYKHHDITDNYINGLDPVPVALKDPFVPVGKQIRVGRRWWHRFMPSIMLSHHKIAGYINETDKII